LAFRWTAKAKAQNAAHVPKVDSEKSEGRVP